MRILLTGADGQLGRLIQLAVSDSDDLTCTTLTGSPSHPDCLALDLQQTGSITALLNRIQPELIINAAAYTAVDRAESEPAMAHAINADAVACLAQWCAEQNARLIHYSTDYVFDGKSSRAYLETDLPAPGSVYGHSKLAAEQRIETSGCRALIFRTAWVYANVGQNFLNTMLRLAAERPEISVVDDQFGLPTWAGSLATLSLAASRKWLQTEPDSAARIYHLSARGEPISWHRFAQTIFEIAASSNLLKQTPIVHSISTAEYPTAAARPAQSALVNDRFELEFDMIVPHWRDQLSQCLSQRSTLVDPLTY